MMNNPDSGSSEWISDTRPARLFSHGSIPKRRGAFAHCVDRRLERQAGQGLHRRIGVAARQIRVGSRQALEGDRHRVGSWVRSSAASAVLGRVPGPQAYPRRTGRVPYARRRFASHSPAPAIVPGSRAVPAGLAAARQSGQARPVYRHRSRRDASAGPGPRESPGARNTAPARWSAPAAKAQAALTKETVVGLDLVADRHHERADIDLRIGQRRDDQSQTSRVQGREITLQIDHDVMLPSGSSSASAACTRSDPDGSAGSVSTARPPAARTAVGDFRVATGDGHRADPGLPPTFQHMHDHRLAVDIGQRLAGQARGGHAGGDDDDRVQ